MDIIFKIRKYCARQERSPFEVKQKLYGWGVAGKKGDKILEELIKENYLDEERFAKHYAVSKFHQKKWGKKKIAAGLQKHDISSKTIQLSLVEIDVEEYRQTLHKLIQAKRNYFSDPEKILRYCMQKGYEMELIEGLFREKTYSIE